MGQTEANAPVMRVLREAKERGITHSIGMAADRGDLLVRVLRNVAVDVCLSAHQYTLLHRESPRIVRPVALEQGMPYIVAAIFQRVGVSSGRMDERINGLVGTSGMSAATLSVRYILADRAIATILIGAANPDEIEEVVRAAMAGPLPPDLHEAIDRLGEP